MKKSATKTKAVAQVNYLPNDPSTPTIKETVTVPTTTALPIGIIGWDGTVTSPKGVQSANVLITLANAIKYTVNLAAKTNSPIKKWPAVKQLAISPRAGQEFNAYYDRRGLFYFYDVDPKTKQVVYAADSGDVVSHECGHALLDAQRPDFWSVQAMEIWAFHEAYADITAICSILLYNSAVQYIMKETGGDLRKTNIVSKLAEQLGRAIYDLSEGHGGYSPDYLRNAINNFKYTPPSRLPPDGPDTVIINEPHSFGRIFLGAWYDILVGFYEYQKTKTANPAVALATARDTAMLALLKAIRIAPRSSQYFNAVGKAMLSMVQPNKDYYAVVSKVLADRNIVPAVRAMSMFELKDLKKTKGKQTTYEARGQKIVKVSNPRTLRLCDYGPKKLVSLSAGEVDIESLEMEVPNDTYYELDKNGNVVHAIMPTEQEVVEEARLCAEFIRSKKALRSDRNTMWQATDGKLVRSFID